jgi:methionyl-tRNA formyltransferase
MDLVFFGSDNFAVPALGALAGSRHKILCVVTQPDRKKGRHLKLSATPVKEAALRLKLKVFQPESMNSPAALAHLKGLRPDLLVVVAYGQILSSAAIALPKIMPINLHASLLPALRGAAPINWAIIKGENKTGVTVMKITQKMDAGPLIARKELAIAPDDTAPALEAKLAVAGDKLLVDCVDRIEKSDFQLEAQDESAATFAPKLKKEDGRIDWSKSAEMVYNLIRGCADWPAAHTRYRGGMLKIHQARLIQGTGGQVSGNGEIIKVGKEGIEVACGKGSLLIIRMQPEARRSMSAAEFIAGHKIKTGERFS